MPGSLRHGNATGHGGRREGSGRKTNQFKLNCQKISDCQEYFDWAYRVVKGEVKEQKLTKDGNVVELEVSITDRKELWKDITAYAHGKPMSVVDMGEEGKTLGIIGVVVLPTDSEGKRGEVRS